METEQPPTSSATAAAIPMSSQPFGLILPGHNVITDFIPDVTGTKFTLNLPFPLSSSSIAPGASCTATGTAPQKDASAQLPLSITDLVFFLLPNIPLPPNCGALLYWSALPIDSSGNVLSNVSGGGPTFELLGALTPTKPSAVFRTGWSNHEQLLSYAEQSMSNSSQMFSGIMITLGVSIEPLDNIDNLQIDQKVVTDRKNIAKNIATDLFNYLQSFDDVGNARNGWMTVPTNVFERWFKRFESKLERDSNFFMKNSIE